MYDFPQQQFGPTINPVPTSQHQLQYSNSFISKLKGQSSMKYLNSSQKFGEPAKHGYRSYGKGYSPSEKGGIRKLGGGKYQTENQRLKISQIESSTTQTQIHENTYKNKYKNITSKKTQKNVYNKIGRQKNNSNQNESQKTRSITFKQLKNKKLTQNDNFYCICQNKNQKQQNNQLQQSTDTYGIYYSNQHKSKQTNCKVCHGFGSTNGTNNMARFMEYLMEFKLGNLPSYTQYLTQNLVNDMNEQQQQQCKNKQQYLQQYNIKDMIHSSKHSTQQKTSMGQNRKKAVTLSHKPTILNKNQQNQEPQMENNKKKANDFCIDYFKKKSQQKSGQNQNKYIKNQINQQQQSDQQGMINNNFSEVELYNVFNSKLNNSSTLNSNKLRQTKNTINSNQSANTFLNTSINSVFSFKNQRTYDKTNNTYINTNNNSNDSNNNSNSKNNNNNSYSQQMNISTINLGLNAMTQSIIDQQGTLANSKKLSKQQKQLFGSGRVSENIYQNQKQTQQSKQEKSPGRLLKRTNNFIQSTNIQQANKNAQSQLDITASFISQNQPTHNLNTKSMFLPKSSLLHQSSRYSSKYQDPRLSLQPTPTFKDFNQFRNNLREQNQIHDGYCCDHCRVEPIVGVRYHCSSFLCNNDYDLCRDCYKQIGHKHLMEQIEININAQKIYQSLQIFSSKTIKSQNKMSKQILNINTQKICQSLHHLNTSKKKISQTSNSIRKNEVSFDRQQSDSSSDSQNQRQISQQRFKFAFKSSIH